ncbi:pyridoxamine 5'-phosphate oxidase family protein [Faecalicoccus pleomorphus]|uniref:pyridoxamine 5'-phosphate oxidase family protein n=1 Tax=Faecalicoccus pleomorphus TaxID=1323 RepID=UPI00195FDE9F|nr:pyridoxamine 5'-phosphate oxidase family protein [Faecalicoccus pleomorphus]MBM6678272.1 pyridoxamine 5'-phosphate oxidase family protein [Faecalicoccus pleomorphus]MDB7987102.1 pyridoxamine 5'-phosphate oxidase family protein [Faecalicoccus pleomorphus]MDB7990958.1 pyridoxamine 5'-phosphate oxidase family protein [Faecalicoccus pleomorphus]
MRRKDREIKDFDKILQIMRQCDSCVLALNDDGFPYMVPLNFGMDIEDGQLYLYFHCAMQGKKLDLIRKDNRATFEMDCDHNFILYDERMSCTMGYSSVVGHGIIEFVEEEKKYEALKILMRQYHAEDFQFNKDMIKVTTVLTMKVLDITGKHRNNIH